MRCGDVERVPRYRAEVVAAAWEKALTVTFISARIACPNRPQVVVSQKSAIQPLRLYFHCRGQYSASNLQDHAWGLLPQARNGPQPRDSETRGGECSRALLQLISCLFAPQIFRNGNLYEYNFIFLVFMLDCYAAEH